MLKRGILTALLIASGAVAGETAWQRYARPQHQGDVRGQVVALAAALRSGTAAIRPEDELAILLTFGYARELVPGDSAYFELLDAAYQSGYRNNLGDVLGPAWIEFAGLLLQRGEPAKAARVISELNRPHDIIDVRADKRFAALVDAEPAHFDAIAAAHRRVDRLQALAERQPRSAEVLVALARARKNLDQPEAALKRIDLALTRLDTYDDRDRITNWVHDERAYVLWRLGRRDEALAELKLGAAVHESRGRNISQRINLVQMYVWMNQPALAIKTLGELDDGVTLYGRMAWHIARLAAADEFGDEKTAGESMDYLRDHEPDAPKLLREALVMRGLLDDGAKAFIGELDDPMFRSDALHEVQEFDVVSGGTSGPERWNNNWKQVLARSDVKAAIARYGRTQRYALPSQ
jgi:tetratricopeptide (TPR) repeat protein